MSYDLMVFNPDKAPKSKSDFMNWYESQTEWKEEHDYDDPKISSGELKKWFLEIIKDYPAMNGPFACDNVDNPKVTDYSVGIDMIYASFSWSEAENAYLKMSELAKKHKIGFFDASGNGDIVFFNERSESCLLYTSPSPRDAQ